MAEFEIEHHIETVNGVTWHWAEAGEGDPVVLLHGIPESWQCWLHQIPTLATQFRVLAFDLKGYGLSDKADGDYSASNVASELLQCLDAIGIDRFRLAGHDWGVSARHVVACRCTATMRAIPCIISGIRKTQRQRRA
jgi:pimeloyl-ACP methyl ester carboxylesterase